MSVCVMTEKQDFCKGYMRRLHLWNSLQESLGGQKGDRKVTRLRSGGVIGRDPSFGALLTQKRFKNGLRTRDLHAFKTTKVGTVTSKNTKILLLWPWQIDFHTSRIRFLSCAFSMFFLQFSIFLWTGPSLLIPFPTKQTSIKSQIQKVIGLICIFIAKVHATAF